ncbi:MAG: thiamine phosphate synthase [Candidatus Scalinduaceae bacterium]
MLKIIKKFDLVLITNGKICESELTTIITQALEGGVRTVQLREKDLSTKKLFELAKRLREITKDLDANLIINDRVDIALAVNADGVHLGWQSLDIDVIRKIIGHEKLIGFSAHNLQEARKADIKGADYITLSPIFNTSYKDFLIQPLGIEEIGKIKKQISIPVIALGGINEDNIREVLENGADGIAVVSNIILSEDPGQSASRLCDEIKRFKQESENRILVRET